MRKRRSIYLQLKTIEIKFNMKYNIKHIFNLIYKCAGLTSSVTVARCGLPGRAVQHHLRDGSFRFLGDQ